MTFRNILLLIFSLAILASIISRQTGRDLGLIDSGPGMTTCSGILLSFVWLNKIKTIRDLKKLSTPSRLRLFLILNLTVLLVLVSIVCYLTPPELRRYFLNYDPSVSPLIAGKFFDICLVILPVNLLGFLLSIGAQYPVPLFQRSFRYNLKGAAFEVLFVALLLLTIWGLIRMVMLGMHEFILASMSAIYVILSLRAGQMHRFSTGTSAYNTGQAEAQP